LKHYFFTYALSGNAKVKVVILCSQYNWI